jgi:pimeloyl-ACP methyl ester carboxylesterase
MVTKNAEFADVGTAKIAYFTFGTGTPTIVIETAMGSCSAEWWHIAEKLSETRAVLVYDRAGYGKSSRSKLPRTPKNVTHELFQLLKYLNVEDPLVLIGHSLGGLYVQQFARSYPELTKGLCLLDPLSANDNVFKAKLSPSEYNQSGVDKMRGLRIAERLCKVRLGFLLKIMLKDSPPFYYYDFGKEARKYLLSSLSKASLYETAIEEYQLAYDDREVANLKTKDGFPDIPLVLITHASNAVIEEIMYYGKMKKEGAEKVEFIWQELMKECLSFASKSKFIQAEKSSHFIHLTEPNLLWTALGEIGH